MEPDQMQQNDILSGSTQFVTHPTIFNSLTGSKIDFINVWTRTVKS